MNTIGMRYSTSHYACMIRFSGGGPYDGKEGLYDNDFANVTICACDGNKQYDYNRAGPRHFKLSRVWVHVDDKTECVDIWDPKK